MLFGCTLFPLRLTPFQVGDTSERGQVPYGSTTAGGGFKPIVPIVSEGDDPGKQASNNRPSPLRFLRRSSGRFGGLVHPCVVRRFLFGGPVQVGVSPSVGGGAHPCKALNV